MFRVYKPKNVVNIKAVQVQKETAQDIANLVMGRVVYGEPDAPEGAVTTRDVERPVVGIEVPTFEGRLYIPLGDWLTRADDNTLGKMENTKFQKDYDVARKTVGSVGLLGNHPEGAR